MAPVLKVKADSTYRRRFVVQRFSQILGMSVTRDREKGAITISQKDYTENVVHRYDMGGCSSAYTPGVGPELSLNQPEEKLLNEVKKWCYQGITGAVHVFCTTHPPQHPLLGQPDSEGRVQAQENSHEGGQASASLLGLDGQTSP